MDFNEILFNVLNWVALQNTWIVGLFFILSNFLENIFPPWPGDVTNAFGGFYVAFQKNSFGPLELMSCILIGNLLGGAFMYAFGKKILDWMEFNEFPFKKNIYDKDQILKTFRWFSRYESLIVLFSRFSAGIRFFVSIIAGAQKMNFLKFMILFNLAVLIWTGLIVAGGFTLGKKWEDVNYYVSLYNKIILTIIILIGILFMIYKKRKKLGTKS